MGWERVGLESLYARRDQKCACPRPKGADRDWFPLLDEDPTSGAIGRLPHQLAAMKSADGDTLQTKWHFDHHIESDGVRITKHLWVGVPRGKQISSFEGTVLVPTAFDPGVSTASFCSIGSDTRPYHPRVGFGRTLPKLRTPRRVEGLPPGPGPGTYEAKPAREHGASGRLPSPPKWSIGKSPRAGFANRSTPGPGTYEPAKPQTPHSGLRGQTAPCYSFHPRRHQTPHMLRFQEDKELPANKPLRTRPW